MAVVNQYKFYGTNLVTTDETILLTTAATENFIIKSLRVTNNTGNTPTITLTNNSIKIVNTQSLVANASAEILTLPMIVQSSTSLKVTMSSTDSVDIGISYLNILKEITA